MSVALVPLTREHFLAVLALELHPPQQHFVASNLFSIAEAYVDHDLTPRVITASGIVIGFLMYGRDPNDGRVWIVRLMVDARHQQQGYGREALRLALIEVQAVLGCSSIYISYTPDNAVAARLYAQLGFEPTGEVLDDEIVACCAV